MLLLRGRGWNTGLLEVVKILLQSLNHLMLLLKVQVLLRADVVSLSKLILKLTDHVVLLQDLAERGALLALALAAAAAAAPSLSRSPALPALTPGSCRSGSGGRVGEVNRGR